MKRNIQFIVLVLAALCLNTEEAFAQNRSYSGDIVITSPGSEVSRMTFLRGAAAITAPISIRFAT